MDRAPLIDACARHLKYLRISVTDRCNLRCQYCMPRDLIPKLTHADILTYEEILRVVKIGISLGVTKVRVTGGEPLIRKGIFAFLKQLRSLTGLGDVSLTTNGVTLEKHLHRIQAAGIKRLNVSLDTLDRFKFKQITGRNSFDQVWQGLLSAQAMGFEPLKINVVALDGINADELEKMAALTFEYPFHVRFIEHMPIGINQVVGTGRLLTPDIKKKIAVLGELVPVQSGATDGPAERFRIKGAIGEVGFISAISRHFCDSCNRLRLTPGGQLRPCLLSDRQVDLKEKLRGRASDEALADLIISAVKLKQAQHGLTDCIPDKVTGQMSSIGG
ncbi:MAG: GTP 3',8-cyclase MoaA [Desulfobacterales bacterium]|nr:GTP 3',8-cyclase MoaA [Desulfobacterales bacterium]